MFYDIFYINKKNNKTIIIEGGLKMVRVSEPLCTERYTGNEFKSASVFNKDTDFDSLNKRIQEHIKESRNKRSKTQKKY